MTDAWIDAQAAALGRYLYQVRDPEDAERACFDWLRARGIDGDTRDGRIGEILRRAVEHALRCEIDCCEECEKMKANAGMDVATEIVHQKWHARKVFA